MSKHGSRFLVERVVNAVAVLRSSMVHPSRGNQWCVYREEGTNGVSIVERDPTRPTR